MSTIKFDHTKETLADAMGIDNEQLELLQKTMCDLSLHIVKTTPTKSEIAEILAKSLSYTELVYLATETVENKTLEALKMYEKHVGSKGESLGELLDTLKKLKDSLDGSPGKSFKEIKSIKIDPNDIDGSLDNYDLPEEVKKELKAKIIEEMRDKLDNQEE